MVQSTARPCGEAVTHMLVAAVRHVLLGGPSSEIDHGSYRTAVLRHSATIGVSFTGEVVSLTIQLSTSAFGRAVGAIVGDSSFETFEPLGRLQQRAGLLQSSLRHLCSAR